MNSFYGLVKLIIYGEEETKKTTKWEFIETKQEEQEEKQEKEEKEVKKQEKEIKEEEEEIKKKEIKEIEENENIIKKHKKKKMKRKKRSNSVNSPEESKKNVHWGDVEEITFTRELGFHTIPHNGLYPLGLGVEEGRYTSTLKKHLSATKIRLIERAIKIGLDIATFQNDSNNQTNKNHHGNDLENKDDDDDNDNDDDINNGNNGNDNSKPTLCLETRQYDYRSGCNMLFRPLSEADRIVVLGQLTRQVTLSDGTSVAILHKELTDIRKSREEIGCNCKQMKLDKLNVARLKQELISYQKKLQQQQHNNNNNNNNSSSNLNPSDHSSPTTTTETIDEVVFDPDYVMLTNKQIDALSKNELVNRLRGIFKSCPLCVLSDCDCFKLEIGCHSNCCSCFRSNSNKNNCNNQYGYHVYDANQVNEYRRQFVTCKSPHEKKPKDNHPTTNPPNTTSNNNNKIMRRSRANST